LIEIRVSGPLISHHPCELPCRFGETKISRANSCVVFDKNNAPFAVVAACSTAQKTKLNVA
jgi:hypothetical protein